MTECYPVSQMPGTSALFRAFCEQRTAAGSPLPKWYPADPFQNSWAQQSPMLSESHRAALAEALTAQVTRFGGGRAAFANVEAIHEGAAAVVTGQQVGLFGGPLLTLLKAATAIRKAQDATEASGRKHVPIFWLATEDHDLPEVDTAVFAAKLETEHTRLGLRAERPLPVGGLPLWNDAAAKAAVEAVLDRVCELLGWAPECDLLRTCYATEDERGSAPTLAGAFGRLLTGLFERFGLIVIDPCGREFHALGAPVLRAAILQGGTLEQRLLARGEELVAAGFHAQVLVTPGHSLLFLLDAETGARMPLRRSAGDAEAQWKAGQQTYTESDLLAILGASPERLSPNALLRPVFQDAILPTAAYIGGPAEVAYFAQSAVVYETIAGRITPVLPRLSATLIEPAIAKVMAQHEVEFQQLFAARTAEELAVRLGARAMPIEGKRKLSATGNAMDTELTALTDYMTALNADLGRAAAVSASKMRYQMNRLRRMAARFELDREAALRKHANAIMVSLYPEEHLQERLLAGIQFLATSGDALLDTLVENAGLECPGHRVLFL